MRDFSAFRLSVLGVARSSCVLALLLGAVGACSSREPASRETVETVATSRSKLVLPVQDAKLAAGPFSNCWISGMGLLKCWGDNSHFQLGIGPGGDRGDEPGEMGSMLPAVDLGTGLHARSVAVGSFQTCALLGDGSVECWGTSESGALGIDRTDTIGDAPSDMGDHLERVHLGGQTVRSLVAGTNLNDPQRPTTFFCALFDTGAVQCWGENQSGQLGVGDTVDRGGGADASVSLENEGFVDLGASHLVEAIAAGSDHACAIFDDGGVKCWGANGKGQLGTGDAINRGDDRNTASHKMGSDLRAVPLGNGRTAVSIVAGRVHTCALLDDSTVKCWGDNEFGQLGNGETQGRGANGVSELGDNLPAVNFGAGRQARALTAGTDHTCAILDNGAMKCWGKNDAGQLGFESTAALQRTPVSVPLGALRTVRAAAAGGTHTCAQLDDASIKCWGSNDNGETGVGMPFQYGKLADTMGDKLPAVPLQQSMPSNAIGDHTCQVLSDGAVKCWGYNAFGQLGIGETSNNRGAASGSMGTALPRVPLGSRRTALQVATGRAHTCVLLDDHSVKCWGANNFGQLGQDSPAAAIGNAGGPSSLESLQPVNLGSGRTAVSIGAGGDTSCAVLDNATLKCWGSNSNYQLGNNTTVSRGANQGDMAALPIIAVGAGRTVKAVSVGYLHVCALLDNGTVKCWGQNQWGQLGIGNFSTYQKVPPVNPVALTTGDVVVSVAAGSGHTCALLSTGAIKCWGRNTYGQSGIDLPGTQGFTADPIAAANPGALAIALTAGGNHTCALLRTGAVRCWGRYDYGAIGPFSHPGSNTPNNAGDEAGDMAALVDISLGTGAAAVAISSMANSTCALLSDGREKCWGYNVYGQLGQEYRNANNAVGYIASEMGDALVAVKLGVDPNLQVSCPVATNGTSTFSVSGNFGYGTTTFVSVSTPIAGGARATVTDIQLGGQLIERYSAESTITNGQSHTNFDYGPVIHGVSHAEFFSDGTSIGGSTDGRALVPVPKSSAQNPAIAYQDGGPAPSVSADPGVLTSLAAIASAANAAIASCRPPDSQLLLAPPNGPLPLPVLPLSEPGHRTADLPITPECDLCLTRGDLVYTECDADGFTMCATIGWAVGSALGSPDTQITVQAFCNAQTHQDCADDQGLAYRNCTFPPPAVCCASACGTCCNAGETCLDPSGGLCCSPGMQPCPGTNPLCFDPAQATCLFGVVCPIGAQRCGSGASSVCCPTGTCNGSTCLPQPTASIEVGVTTKTEGAYVCTKVHGLTPNSPFQLEYDNIPGKPAAVVFHPSVGDPRTTDNDGSFSVRDTSLETFALGQCDTAQLTSSIGVRATDATGRTVATTFPAGYFCGNATNGGTYLNGCL